MARFIPSTEPPFTTHRTFRGAVAVFERLTQALTSDRAVAITLAVSIVLALVAPLGPLAAHRFHRDEAIYSSWGLDIASGRDLLVSGSPVDKPPLFLYTQALSFLIFGPTEVAARLPSLIASVISVALTYALGRSLYGRGVGLLAAFLLAASPFAILFAPTAFTDPMMVALMLAGCLAAVQGHWGWAGVALGLAAITKQQGAFFVPLALGLGRVSNQRFSESANQRINRSQIRNPQSSIVLFAVGFSAVLGLAVGWDVARAREPGFLAQSLVSYGRLAVAPAVVWERLLGFLGLLRSGTGSPVLNGTWLGGVPLLLAVDLLTLARSKTKSSRLSRAENQRTQVWADLLLLAFSALFLIGHSVVVFRVWDRYLLGLIPLLALLLARVLTLPWRLPKGSPISSSPISNFLYLVFVICMLSFTLSPIRDASAGRFPIGGDHGAYQGIEQVVSYFQAVPADTTLYHRWLGWHWRFYLRGRPYDFRAWTSPADLAAQATDRPGANRYVVFPSWRSPTEARLALADAGLSLREMHRAFRDDGSVSFVVYRIQEAR